MKCAEEKSLREMLNALKSFKTAKFANFWAQGYQGLSKTHDFAGETISFRFRFTWFRFRFARNLAGASAGPARPRRGRRD
jgi:hypothetical protein